jgi:hypothetical protein
MADPILNYVSLLGSQVSATFENFPTGSRVVVVNNTSGQAEPAPVTELGQATSGPLGVNLPPGFPSGDFYLKGLDAPGGYLAQSVVFHF